MVIEKVSRKISNVISDLTDLENLEIEAKIKNISDGDFYMISDYLKSNFRSEKSNTVDYYDKKERITEEDGKFFNTSKTNIYYTNIDYNDRLIKITVSKEENKILDILGVEKYDFKREKERTSYFDNNFRYDLTKVTEFPKNLISYELEVEIINPEKYESEKFSEIIMALSEFISSYTEEINQFFNVSLSEGKDNSFEEIKYYLISKPRELKKEDLTSVNSILKNFTVSIKADGVQYFLLFHKSGIWLISLVRKNIRLCGLTEKFSHLENSIFVGEILNKENLKPGSILSSNCVYLPFDTIAYKNVSVVNKTYLERTLYLQEIISKDIFCDGVKKVRIIEKKIFPLGENSKDFYKGFLKCIEEKKKIEYKDDGFIFTPVNSPYVTKGQFVKKQNERILKNYLDVCKFKPVEKRSVDLKVKNGKVYSLVNKKDLRILENIGFDLDFKEDIEDKIVEFFPHFESNKIILKPERIRSDKNFPNREDIVLQIIKTYTEPNPITEETLSGKDTVLMRQFNNSLKLKIINDIEGYVVDIGGGKGGDIKKFGPNKKIKKVISIEPNKEFSDEYQRRLKSSIWKNKFHLLPNTKGEDTDIIIENLKKIFPDNMKDEKLTITFMISLSFFWSSEEILNSLARTINEINILYKSRGGKGDLEVVFFTIEEERVKTLFKKHGKNSIQLNTIKLSLGEGNQVYVDIADSKTVSQQVEYLVNLNSLFEKAGLEKIYLKSPEISKKLLMSVPESIYINLFVYGKYKLTKKPNFSYVLNRLEVNVKKGQKIDKKIMAKGDDMMFPINFIDPKVYRISTINFNMSLSNSISKLLNENYRNSDVYERISIAKDLHKKIKDLTMEEVSDVIDHGIKIYHGKNISKYGLDNNCWIILNKCIDNSFEPIVYKSENINYVFSDKSFLIK